MLAVIKHVVDDNITCLLATQLMHAPAHGARNIVQQLLRKTLNLTVTQYYGTYRGLVVSFAYHFLLVVCI